MIIQDLLARLGFEIDKKPLEQVEEKLEGINRKLEFLAAAEVVRGLYELAERFAGLGEQIETAAVSAGITTDAFQKLAYAASQNSVNQEELSGSLARLTRTLYNAQQGSQSAVDSFASLGITPQQVAGFKNSTDALHAVSDAFTGISDPIKKQAVAMELFGRGSANMVKFLSVGGAGIDKLSQQAEDMGAVLSEEGVESLAKFEDTMQGLGQVIKVFLATVASRFTPAIIEAVKALEQMWAANREVIASNLDEWALTAAKALGFTTEAIRIAVGAFADFIKAHPVLTKYAGEAWLAMVGLSLAIGAVSAVISGIFGPFGKLIDLFTTVISVGPKGFGLALQGAELLRSGLAALAIRIGLLAAGAFPGLSAAAFAFLEVIQAMTAGTFALWIAGIAATIGGVVLVVQAIWAMLHGKSFWDTWLGEGLQAIVKYGAKALGFVKGIFGYGAKSGDPSLAQAGEEDIPGMGIRGSQAADNPGWRMDLGGVAQLGQSGMANLAGMAGAPQAVMPLPGAVAGGPMTWNMTQNNNITVPPGTDPKDVGPYLQRGIQEATQRQLREAHRGLQTAAVH